MHFPIAPERFDGRTETRLADHLHQRSKGEPRISAAFGVTRRFKVWTGALTGLEFEIKYLYFTIYYLAMIYKVPPLTPPNIAAGDERERTNYAPSMVTLGANA